ncbi:hypothetical protein CL634_06195 [bacterium]|nr:hypothetical protein [bacterium]
MASIDFYAAANTIATSGLGFFGGSFGQAVEINKFQDTTYITDSAGTVQGAAVNNIKYYADTTAFAPSIVPSTGIHRIPNAKATLNIRFTHSSTVRTQNAKLRIYDRTNKDYPASGVITRVAELLHTSASYDVEGSGDTTWYGSATGAGSPNPSTRLAAGTNTVGGSGIIVPLAQSPGPTGYYAGNGTANTGQYTQHDWYVAISASPDSIGSKTQYGLYIELEYL